MGHIGLNILYWTCTFNFRPKFERRLSSPFWAIVFTKPYPYESCNFWPKIEVIYGGFFSRNLYLVVLIIPSATFRSIRAPDYRQKRISSWPRHLILINCYPQFSGKLGDRSEPYWPQHIILDVYIQFYSKFSTSPAVASSEDFFRHTIPLGNL